VSLLQRPSRFETVFGRADVKPRLLCLDVDGTLIRSFLREGAPKADYDLVEVLPGRRDALEELRRCWVSFALVTNQAGVSHGYQTPEQVERKLDAVREAIPALKSASVHVCFAHAQRPNPGADSGDVRWDVRRRKPAGLMISDAATRWSVPLERTVMVGDLPSDRAAAEDAGVRYLDTTVFPWGRSR
jgi:HAD superfamily hydrolase (TIGR01662 family)